MGNHGPMQLEVPRDQYAGAVETMKNKIREGKVPGVTDPAEASRLIRRGHLTYTQARNITGSGPSNRSLMILPRGRLSVWRPEGSVLP